VKPVVWLGDSRARVKDSPADARRDMAKFSEAVYVLHAFQKKSRKTARADIELARLRFRTLIRDRRLR
jgi:phage-related protein